MIFFNIKYLNSNTICYADDTVLMYPVRNETDYLNFVYFIKLCLIWFDKNHLIINADKTFFQIFHLHKIYYHIDTLNINEYSFEKKYHNKYLGIEIDSNLKFIAQYKKIIHFMKNSLRRFF